MAIPTAPTPTTLVTEALKEYGFNNPSSSEITRAIDYGLELVKWQIWELGHTWDPLKTVYYHVTNEGVSKYTNPSDFDSHLSLVRLAGDHDGLLTAVGSASSITLAADEDAQVADVEGHLILITSGTGVNQAVQCDDYNTTTKVATMAESFETTPAIGDGYLIISQEKGLDQYPISVRDKTSQWHDKSPPNSYFPISNSTYGGFELFPVPDDVYGIQQRYFANLLMVDLAGTRYATLLRRWHGVLVQGVLAWRLKQADDSRYSSEFLIYDQMLKSLRAKDLYGMDLSNLQATVKE